MILQHAIDDLSEIVWDNDLGLNNSQEAWDWIQENLYSQEPLNTYETVIREDGSELVRLKTQFYVNEDLGVSILIKRTYPSNENNAGVTATYEISNNTDMSDFKLRIHIMDENFNIKSNTISNVAIKNEVIYNEWSGNKESTRYVNENGDLVAVKNFTIYQGQLGKGTKLRINFYNVEGVIGATFETKDIYTPLQISQYKTKCANRVLDILFYDIEETIDVLNNASMTNEAESLRMGTDQLFKQVLFQEVQILRTNGNTKPIYDKVMELSSQDYPLLDAVFPTAVLGRNVREILLAKFNPENFNFYNE